MSHWRVHRHGRKLRPLGIRWAAGTVAPWALSAGLLISFTASAGQNFGASGLPSSTVWRVAPGPASELAEGPSMLVAASAFRLPGLALTSAIVQARLSFEDPERRIVIDPRAPREEMKRAASGFPEVDRTAKGDMLPSLRPGLTGNPALELERVVFGDTQPKLISGGFSLDALSAAEAPDGPQTGFEPYAGDEGLTDPASSESSPVSLKPKITSARQGELHLESIDGSSPLVPQASQRSSATPLAGSVTGTLTPPAWPAHAAPQQQRGQIALVPPQRDLRLAQPGVKQDYAGLIAPENMAKEQRCLAEAVYFEARSESLMGQAAVAQVVLNRVKSGLYPASVCGVVYQNSNRYLSCQFTFTCEGKSLRITEPAAWRDAVRIAREVYDGTTYLPDVGASTHYHANYVRPYWAKRLKKMDTIGQHVFYKLRPGQS
ncbi:cell wall hydrolase [Bosea sp. (in: a-proteobacteria)]|uniref:cell wall hydrolase n=1 Tax=Bosea sp. (in: a-proteobacteria) TaxID=1871050 RepID=UPI00260498A6|nr:cell wall hydrolase [Bosea sp. (in: a-proteobacteria)]MCO5092438.1 cell wall hydrolase [Bosea sp. (in: a-proteobacteria)]